MALVRRGAVRAVISIIGLAVAACQDAASEDEPTGTVAAAATSCTCGTPPCACEDGQTAGCPSNPPPTAVVHHLLSFVNNTDPLGVCVAVVPPVAGCSGSVRGDVITLTGSGGEGYQAKENAILTGTGGCLRVENVSWQGDWEVTGASFPGSILTASLRFKAVSAWINNHVRQAATTPYCAFGSSAGSSLLLYQLFHNGLKVLFDHIQTINATPFSRIDLGCSLTTQAPPRVCSNSGAQTDDSQYGSAAGAVRRWTQDSTCATATPDTAAFLAQSILTSNSVPVLTLSKTTLSAFRCGKSSNGLNATYGQAEYIFGASADLATTAQGKILLAKTPVYANGQRCATPASCPVNFVCETDCTDPEGLTQTDFDAAAHDMIANCVVH